MNVLKCGTRKSRWYLLLGIFLIGCTSKISAQDSLAIYRLDDRHLNLWSGTVVVNDITAHGGTALFRPASASNDTFWFGPYKHFQAGNYLVQFRLKVTSNLSGSDLLNLNVVSTTGGVGYGLVIKPNMFRNSNEWQLFTIPVQIPDNVNYLEVRGTNFIGGLTDVYMDYITIVPGDVRGLYSDEFSVDGKGNVGIGVVDPQGYKLAVNGKIRAQEIKVEASPWPDYVFANDYQLPSLQQTEQHIKEKGHLPGIPSAAEVKANGIDLGEMNAKLLQKIEEMTLYLIEMNSRLGIVENENAVLKKSINK